MSIRKRTAISVPALSPGVDALVSRQGEWGVATPSLATDVRERIGRFAKARSVLFLRSILVGVGYPVAVALVLWQIGSVRLVVIPVVVALVVSEILGALVVRRGRG